MIAWRMRITSLGDEPPYWLSNTEWSTKKSYKHKQQKGTQQVISISIKDKMRTTWEWMGGIQGEVTGRDPGTGNWEEPVWGSRRKWCDSVSVKNTFKNPLSHTINKEAAWQILHFSGVCWIRNWISPRSKEQERQKQQITRNVNAGIHNLHTKYDLDVRSSHRACVERKMTPFPSGQLTHLWNEAFADESQESTKNPRSFLQHSQDSVQTHRENSMIFSSKIPHLFLRWAFCSTIKHHLI